MIFDLEQFILNCWNITDDLRRVAEATSDEKTAVILKGMAELYDLKFNTCFESFEGVCKEYHMLRKS